jgi:hypothetical protein
MTGLFNGSEGYAREVALWIMDIISYLYTWSMSCLFFFASMRKCCSTHHQLNALYAVVINCLSRGIYRETPSLLLKRGCYSPTIACLDVHMLIQPLF